MKNQTLNNLIIEDLGLTEYKSAWDYQKKLMQKIISFKLSKRKNESTLERNNHYLIYCEHPNVITMGKSGNEKNLLINNSKLKEKNIQYIKTDRGGDITFHGPGQIVGYPVIDLENLNIGVKEYIFKLEEVIILTLNDYHIKGERHPQATGVWLDPQNNSLKRKICSIGVRCSRFVTMHGFALNVYNDLSFFDFINPCGFSEIKITSVKEETGAYIQIKELINKLSENFSHVFGIKINNQ